jgi:lipopolysaccharide assembly LptE-like protein
MLKTKTTTLFILLAGILLFSGCGIYSFTGASIPPGAQSVSIKHFPNNAQLVMPTLSHQFTDALRDKFVSQTDLSMISENGDLQFEGEITGYNIKPVAITGDQSAALNRLEITVKVSYINSLEDSKNFDQKFSRYVDYPSTENLSSIQADLIDEINEMLVDDIFNKAVVNW